MYIAPSADVPGRNIDGYWTGPGVIRSDIVPDAARGFALLKQLMTGTRYSCYKLLSQIPSDRAHILAWWKRVWDAQVWLQRVRSKCLFHCFLLYFCQVVSMRCVHELWRACNYCWQSCADRTWWEVEERKWCYVTRTLCSQLNVSTGSLINFKTVTKSSI